MGGTKNTRRGINCWGYKEVIKLSKKQRYMIEITHINQLLSDCCSRDHLWNFLCQP